jgi:hypothetical protein
MIGWMIFNRSLGNAMSTSFGQPSVAKISSMIATLEVLLIPVHQPGKLKLFSNLLFPQLRRTIAKLAKQPIWDVLPATTEQEDINVANISKKYPHSLLVLSENAK